MKKNDEKNGQTGKRFVVVTTEKRGVFAGYLANTDDAKSLMLRLTDAQMCVYWSADCKGVLGLASNGPTRGCRITAPIPAITLHGVTAVMEASATSEEAWKAQPWN